MTQIGSHYLPEGKRAGMWFICSCYSRVTCKTVPTPGDQGIWGQCEWLNYNLGKVCRKDTPIWKPGRTNTSSQMQCFSFQLQRAPKPPTHNQPLSFLCMRTLSFKTVSHVLAFFCITAWSYAASWHPCCLCILGRNWHSLYLQAFYVFQAGLQ